MANKDKYSVAEKLSWCRESWLGVSLRRTRDNFAGAHPNRPIPSIATIRKTIKRFNETGCLDCGHVKHTRPARRLTDDEKMQICLCFEENRRTSTRRVSAELGLAQSTVMKVLHEHKYFPFKLHREQELYPGDDDNRMAFCETMMDRINDDPGLPRRICFTDESTVLLYGTPNRQNVRIWSVSNPYESIQIRTQYPQKLNIWAGVLDGRIIGPLYIDGNLTGEKYLQLLQNQIVPAVRALEGNGPPVYFQQDGAPPHTTLAVRAYLNQQFPERWIGRYGPIPWPARSPDLSPLDYSYWGHIKSLLYATRVQDLDDLRARVNRISNDLSRAQIYSAIDNFYDRLGYCVAVQGGTFEKFL